jgi:hypothetical protein
VHRFWHVERGWWMLVWHGLVQTCGVKLGLLTFAVAQFFDFGTFVTMVGRHGPEAEANPLVAMVLVGHGVPLLFVAKLAVVALAVAVVAVLVDRTARRPSPRLAASVLTVGILAGLIGGVTNAANLL